MQGKAKAASRLMSPIGTFKNTVQQKKNPTLRVEKFI